MEITKTYANLKERFHEWIGFKRDPLEEKFKKAEEITLKRLNENGYVPRYLKNVIAQKEGYSISDRIHSSEIHLVGYNPFKNIIFYRLRGDVKKVKILDNFFRE